MERVVYWTVKYAFFIQKTNKIKFVFLMLNDLKCYLIIDQMII